jgi:hypothetical protein
MSKWEVTMKIYGYVEADTKEDARRHPELWHVCNNIEYIEAELIDE